MLLVRLIRGKSCQSQQHTGQDFPRGVLVARTERYNESAEPFLWTKSEVRQRRVKR